MKTCCYRGRKILISVSLAIIFALALLSVSCGASATVAENADGHIILNCTFDYMKTGDSRRYYVRQNPSSAGYETFWESENGNVATVDGNGVVTAVGAGETSIVVRAINTPYKAVLKLTVADEIVEEKDGENALQLAVDKVKNSGSVLVIGGYYPTLKVEKQVSVTGVGDAAIGDITVEKEGQLFLYSTSVYAACETDLKGCVTVGKNARFTAVRCSFFYDDPSGEKKSENAVYAPADATEIYCRACSFNGYGKCVQIGATDGEIFLVNNDFSDAETAVEIDLRVNGSTADKNARGEVKDNVYIGCKTCVDLYYNALAYTGALEITDADVKVPS